MTMSLGAWILNEINALFVPAPSGAEKMGFEVFGIFFFTFDPSRPTAAKPWEARSTEGRDHKVS